MAPRLLVVEDEAIIHLALEATLTDAGYDVVLAHNSDEALGEVRAAGRDFALLITDIRMPGGLSGWDLAKEVRGVTPQIPVIYMTGDSSHEWETHGVANSAYLEKPFPFAELLDTVARLLEGQDG